MEWTLYFFLAKATQWKLLHDQLLAQDFWPNNGHICYAQQQRRMWCEFTMNAQARYQAFNPDLPYVSVPA
jgi:hypothetical protein